MAEDRVADDSNLDQDQLEVEDGNSVEEKPQKKAAKHDSGKSDLEKVTDYAEEKEIGEQDILKAMSIFGDKHSKETAEKAARQKELAKVVIKRDDVELIMNELEVPRTVAELKLREHHGNLVEALVALTN